MDKTKGMLVGRHPLVAKWILGDRLQNLPRQSRFSFGDLSAVSGSSHLRAILASASCYAQWLDEVMALFLLAPASTCRASQIHALCIDPTFLIQKPQSFRLALNAAFMPKTLSLPPFTQSLLARGLHLMRVPAD